MSPRAPARLASNAVSAWSLPSELRPWPGFCLLWEELALSRLLNIPDPCLSACPGSQVSEAAEVWVKSSPAGFPRSLGAPGCKPSRAKRVGCSQALDQSAPVQRTQENQGSIGPPLSAQACLWPCCYGGCLKSPSGPRLLKAPAQRWSELRGNSTAPSAKHAPKCLSSGSWHLPRSGSFLVL